MWNMDYVIPSLLVLAVLLIFYFARPRLPNQLNRAFLFLLISDIATIVTDFLATCADNAYHSLPLWLVSVLNLHILRSFLFLRFTAVLVKLDRVGFTWPKALSYFILLVCEAIVVTSPLTGAVYTVDAMGYHRGPLYVILALSSFAFLLLGISLLFRFQKSIRKSALISAMAYHAILIAGNVLRILFPQYLVMNVFCLLAILVIYLAFENPDLYITDRGPAFNTRAFTDWLDDPQHRKDSRILGFAIRNYNDERSMYGGIQMDEGLGLIIAWLKKQFPDLLLFYLRGGNFCVAGAEDTEWEQVRKKILERFQAPWQAESVDLNLSATCVEIRLADRTDSPDRIVNTLIYALDQARDSADIEQTLMSEETLRQIDRQIEIKRYLDTALEHNTVEVFLQPIVDSHTQQIVAAEALARLRNDRGELIPPGLFIPMAEKHGSINLLGEQVMRKVCAFIRDCDVLGMGLRWINVNLSPIQCMHSNLPDLFSSILTEYGVSANQIHLEITEESMINYSKIAFSNIKLDMKIVWDYIHDRDALLPSLVHAFRQMGFSITAEGIETQEMAEAMAEIGCDYLQGYVFSKPLPVDNFTKILQPAALRAWPADRCC